MGGAEFPVDVAGEAGCGVPDCLTAAIIPEASVYHHFY